VPTSGECGCGDDELQCHALKIRVPDRFQLCDFSIKHPLLKLLQLVHATDWTHLLFKHSTNWTFKHATNWTHFKHTDWTLPRKHATDTVRGGTKSQCERMVGSFLSASHPPPTQWWLRFRCKDNNGHHHYDAQCMEIKRPATVASPPNRETDNCCPQCCDLCPLCLETLFVGSQTKGDLCDHLLHADCVPGIFLADVALCPKCRAPWQHPIPIPAPAPAPEDDPYYSGPWAPAAESPRSRSRYYRYQNDTISFG